ncbi:MAG: hypothetical protein JO128_18720 [Alphaproteobacteria bacterium]|nr:hypothetical protein [Alphaproteobacteria bacterium]
MDGGDSRLVLDPHRHTNKYGCGPLPDPELLAFGSSTASVISDRGFAAAERLRRRLVKAAASEPAHVTYARELQRLRRDLLRLCGLSDMTGVEVVFAASGTDLHLIAAQLVSAGQEGLLAIAVEASETGSGVPAALAGRHFSTSTALGQTVVDGTSVAGGEPVEVVAVPGRAPDGALRPSADVDGEVCRHALEASAHGRHVLLTLADVSKTGMLSPSADCALDLHRRFYGGVDVLVDGCQFRLSAATLRAYLGRGFMVAVTGSKFLTGPAFSGALLVPVRLASRFRDGRLPAGLAAYSARAEWPAGWAAADALPELANYGLLLRWQAALVELEAFAGLSDEDVSGFIGAFGRAVTGRLAADPLLEAVPAPGLDRGTLAATASWDRLPTILPFLLRRADGSYLTRPATERVYKALAEERCQVGQPVACGTRDGVAVSALRLCLSARLIVEAVQGGRASPVIERGLSILEQASRLAGGA